MFITIVGVQHYIGIESLSIGQELLLIKEPENKFDDESIKVVTESGVTCGHVANSVYSVARGTHSAGYIYNSIDNDEKCRIIFIIDDKVIAEIG